VAEAEPCKECGAPARVLFHLDVIAAYTANQRECVRSGRMTYCGSIAAPQTPIADRKEAFRERLISISRAEWNIQQARQDALQEPPGWRHRVLSALADAKMYIDRVEPLVQGETDRG